MTNIAVPPLFSFLGVQFLLDGTFAVDEFVDHIGECSDKCNFEQCGKSRALVVTENIQVKQLNRGISGGTMFSADMNGSSKCAHVITSHGIHTPFAT
jgi:hypothetical protein